MTEPIPRRETVNELAKRVQCDNCGGHQSIPKLLNNPNDPLCYKCSKAQEERRSAGLVCGFE